MPSNTKAIDPIGILGGYTQPEKRPYNSEEQDLVGQLRTMFDAAYTARLPYERQWELYRLYLKGEQLLYRDKDTGELVRLIDYDNKRLFSLNNQLRPAWRSLVGKLTRSIPSFSVLPSTSSQIQIHAARVAETFLRFWRRKEKFNAKYVRSMQNLAWAGISVLQLYWDPNAGRQLNQCQQCGYMDDLPDGEGKPCPNCSQQIMMAQQQAAALGAPQPPTQPPTLQQFNDGDVRCRTHDPRDVWPEPGVPDPDDMRYIFVRRAIPVSEARRMFPEHAAHLSAEAGLYADRTARVSYSIASGTWGADYLTDHLYLYEYYEKPTALYPKGRVVYMANDRILADIQSPYHCLKRLPFYWQFWDYNPGEFNTDSWIVNGWHRQKELNEVETQVREHTELTSRTKVLNPVGNQLPSDEVTATTAQVLTYNPSAGPPSYLTPPMMSPAVYERRNSLVGDVQLQASVTESEMGMSPSDPNGRALAIMEAESDQQIGPMMIINYSEMGELHRGVLLMVQERYAPDRKFAIAGDEKFEVYSLQDMNLEPGWDLDLEIEDGLSKNQAVRIQQGIDLANLGLFTDKNTGAFDSSRFAKMARMKVPGMAMDTASSEYSAAQAMLRKLEDRIQPMPQPGMEDDPAIFREVMLDWLRNTGRDLQFKDPQLVEIVRQYYMLYAQAAMAQMLGRPPVLPESGGSKSGSDQSAPGGSANNPGHVASGVAQQAQGRVQEADRGAEAQARVTQNREG
jgi:hypothetical protein